MQEILDKLLHDQLLLFATPVFVVVMLIEAYISYKKQLALYDTKDAITSMLVGIITLVFEFGFKFGALIAFELLHELSPLRDVVGRQWWAFVILFFLDDFAYYWFHRMNHEVRLFWAGHVNHHSSQYLNYATALRQGVGERAHKYLFWMWIPLLGFDGVMMFTMMAANLIYQFFTHTELVKKLPWPIEYIFNTPSHHRAHHASNIRYLDRNHAGVLIIWDRMFGTFAEEVDSEKPIYGLTSNIETNNIPEVVLHEYKSIWRDVRRAKKLSDKLKYIFYAPGWSHDGEDLRAKTLRAKLGKITKS